MVWGLRAKGHRRSFRSNSPTVQERTFMTLPLTGVKVLDFSEHGFVPAAAAALADFGADVVKIERVEGDAMRSRSEEPTSELQSLMRISYAVFCLTKKMPSHYSQSY